MNKKTLNLLASLIAVVMTTVPLSCVAYAETTELFPYLGASISDFSAAFDLNEEGEGGIGGDDAVAMYYTDSDSCFTAACLDDSIDLISITEPADPNHYSLLGVCYGMDRDTAETAFNSYMDQLGGEKDLQSGDDYIGATIDELFPYTVDIGIEFEDGTVSYMYACFL